MLLSIKKIKKVVGLGAVAAILFGSVLAMVSAQDAAAAPSASAPTTETKIDQKDEMTIDWVAEVAKGGLTSLALILLSIAAVAFTVERLYHLRRKYVAPVGYVNSFRRLWKAGDLASIRRQAKVTPSVLSEIGAFITDHTRYKYDMLTTCLADIAGRAMERHSQRAYPMAIIATMSPLLGLLGTMIGMIEAFQKVAVFGDTGDASLLADSIGKALITTAVGLILAIPSLGVYHFLKQKISLLSLSLEEDTEEILAIIRGDDTDTEAPAADAAAPSAE